MMKGIKIDHDRARAIGKQLFQKCDINKKSYLEPKQCYQVFSDYCYRILNIAKPPTMEDADSMHEVLDENRDRRVTESDFQNLAVRYLCGSSFSTNRFQNSTVKTTVEYRSTNTKQLTSIARKRLDVVRRLFKMFDKDNSGYLSENQIPYILEETYREMGQSYKPSQEDVKSYMRMVDTNRDGRISMDQFEQIVLKSLKNSGFQIYE